MVGYYIQEVRVKKNILIVAIISFINMFWFQACKQKAIMPENVKILKGYDYSNLKGHIGMGKFVNDKKLDKRKFSEVIKKEFESSGFVFNDKQKKFLLNGNLLVFNKNDSTDLTYTNIDGVSVPIEDMNVTYDISFNLSIKELKTGKEIWSCKISYERETDYPEAMVEKMVEACIKTILTNKKNTGIKFQK